MAKSLVKDNRPDPIRKHAVCGLRPGYFLLQLKDCFMKTYIVLVEGAKYLWPQTIRNVEVAIY